MRDPGDNRTNLYLLGLAHSSAGMDRPRKINVEILHTIGLSGQLGGRFASGEGLQDALFTDFGHGGDVDVREIRRGAPHGAVEIHELEEIHEANVEVKEMREELDKMQKELKEMQEELKKK